MRMGAFSGSAVLALLLATSSATAQHTFGQLRETQNPYGTVREMPVFFGDLDVGREEGASALLGRLSAAAQRVCSPADTADLNLQIVYHRCLHIAMDRAVADAGSPLVASLYTGQPPTIAQNTNRPVVAIGSRRSALNGARHRRHAQNSKHRRV
jgi:UrcA family protein